MTDAPITPPFVQIAVNAANEGIPVAAIARMLKTSLSDIYETLKDEQSRGTIVDMPRSDWPPGTSLALRHPEMVLPSDGDMAFLCKKAFRLTSLEARFLVVLLKNRQVEKTRFHNIIEQQRMTRATHPNLNDPTDPKMVDVLICKLRKKLKVIDKDLKIETIWGGGYYIEPAMKPNIILHMTGAPHETQETAAGSGGRASGGAAEGGGPTHY